ncbi:acetate--CoA ligase family protein [Intrasporangium chromatireducens]|uniref:acetate--CoA ligase family protein n=1 Tax=Intrasporangium chromatireducens TaxID=1386088 RepID=UPI0004B00A37|nr:acetate--CoA ligase family protein [Intrasporangium chromatireducens]
MTATTTQTSEVSVSAQRVGQALLAPAAVAIVGASDDPSKTTARPLRFLREAGFAGRVYPINPRRETVLGEQAWPSIAALPETPDHVFIVADTRFVVDAVRDCGIAGVPVVTILSGGFGEGGAEEKARAAELRAVAREHGVRLVGPNSIGVVNSRNGLMLTANAAFAEEAPVGTSLVASQSGSVIGALMTRAKARGLGFAGFVSTGSELDLTLGEICELTLTDPQIQSYTLFLESLENAGDLARFAAGAAAHGKPTTVYKLGRSDAAAALSMTHTGSLAGEDAEAEAFFRACGFARVDNFEALIEAEALQRRVGPPSSPARSRVGVITTTGGGAAIVVDQLETRGVSIARPSAAVFEQLAVAGLDVADNLIIDLTLAGTRHDLVRAALQVMADSGEFDLILFVIGSSARLNPELAVSAIAESAAGTVPIAAWPLPDAIGSLTLLHEAGVPAFRTAEACADAVAAVLRRQPSERHVLEVRHEVPSHEQVVALDELSSGVLLREVGASFPATTTCGLDGVPLDPPVWPVAVKALSGKLLHKSDAGGVVLGVRDQAGLAEAVSRIAANTTAYDPELGISHFLVQNMAEGVVAEALVGYRVSPSVGPLIMIAAGGTLTELYGDSSLRLAPVSVATARQMISEVTGLRVAEGFRGGPVGDLDALAEFVSKVSQLAASPEIVEAEVNPVAVLEKGRGVVALDAVVRRAVEA